MLCAAKATDEELEAVLDDAACNTGSLRTCTTVTMSPGKRHIIYVITLIPSQQPEPEIVHEFQTQDAFISRLQTTVQVCKTLT